MDHFKYKVIPAPRNGVRSKGAKGPAGRYAGALENAINVLAADGWEYLRAESLPMDERHGITMRKTETYQNVLIFRKPVASPSDMPPLMAKPEIEAVPEELFDDISDDYLSDEEAIVIEEDIHQEGTTEEKTEEKA